MATSNNIPDLGQMMTFEYNPQILYETLLDFKVTLDKQARDIAKLKKEIKRLNDDS